MESQSLCLGTQRKIILILELDLKKLSLQSPQNSWLKDGKIKEYINDIFHSKNL